MGKKCVISSLICFYINKFVGRDEEWLLVESRTKSRYIVEKKTLYIYIYIGDNDHILGHNPIQKILLN
jgi:hypothetical protein